MKSITIYEGTNYSLDIIDHGIAYDLVHKPSKTHKRIDEADEFRSILNEADEKFAGRTPDHVLGYLWSEGYGEGAEPVNENTEDDLREAPVQTDTTPLTEEMIGHAIEGRASEFQKSFETILRTKLAEAVDDERIEVAQTIFEDNIQEKIDTSCCKYNKSGTSLGEKRGRDHYYDFRSHSKDDTPIHHLVTVHAENGKKAKITSHKVAVHGESSVEEKDPKRVENTLRHILNRHGDGMSKRMED